MKRKRTKILVITLVITLFAGTTVYAANKWVVKKSDSYMVLKQDVYKPKKIDKGVKLPVVFMVHNGNADKSAWGDFPEVIAKNGFLTVNITWKSWDTTDIKAAIDYTLNKYAKIIDKEKVIFIGACHGGKEMLEILNEGTTDYTVKTAVLLSVSEIDETVTNSLKKGHVPMLVYYSKNDEYGKEIGDTSKKFAQKVVTKPCKVVAQKDPAHGNNMVTTSKNKAKVRKDIINWIKKYK